MDPDLNQDKISKEQLDKFKDIFTVLAGRAALQDDQKLILDEFRNSKRSELMSNLALDRDKFKVHTTGTISPEQRNSLDNLSIKSITKIDPISFSEEQESSRIIDDLNDRIKIITKVDSIFFSRKDKAEFELAIIDDDFSKVENTISGIQSDKKLFNKDDLIPYLVLAAIFSKCRIFKFLQHVVGKSIEIDTIWIYIVDQNTTMIDYLCDFFTDHLDPKLDVNIRLSVLGLRILAGSVEKLQEELYSLHDYADEIKSMSYLHLAAYRRDSYAVQVASIIIQYNKISSLNAEGFTPLHLAATYGLPEQVDFFIENGADIYAVQKEGITPLSIAFDSRNEKNVEILLSKSSPGFKYSIDDIGVSDYLREELNDRYIKELCFRPEILKFLPNNKSLKSRKVVEHLIYAFNKETLTQKKLTRSISKFFSNIIEFGDIELARYMIIKTDRSILKNSNALINILESFVRLKEQDMIEQLVPLLLKKIKNNGDIIFDVLESLISKGNIKNIICLVKQILQFSQSANIQNEKGFTPLQCAVQSGNLPIVRELLSSGAETNIKNNYGIDPLMRAILNQNKMIITLFFRMNKVRLDEQSKAIFDYCKYIVSIENKDDYKSHVEFLIWMVDNDFSSVHYIDYTIATAVFDGIEDLVLHLFKKHSNFYDIFKKNDDSYDLIKNKKIVYFLGFLDRLNRYSEARLIIFREKIKAYSSFDDAYDYIVSMTEELEREQKVNFYDVRSDIQSKSSTLYQILKIGDYKRLSQLGSVNSNIRFHDINDFTMLHVAAFFGQYEAVKFLLEMGVNKNALDSYNRTPLHTAIFYRNIGVAKLLIEKRADFTIREKIKGMAALHYIIINDDAGDMIPLAKAIISQGGNPNITNDLDQTPLHLALYFRKYEMVKYLLSIGALLLSENSSQFNIIEAIKNDNCDELKRSVRNITTITLPNAFNFTLLHIASLYGSANILNYLIQEGCDINAVDQIGRIALDIALRCGHNHLIKDMADTGAKFRTNYKKSTVPIFKYLINEAQENKVISRIKAILGFDVDLGAQDDEGRTPLSVSFGSHKYELAKQLIQEGVNLDVRDEDGSNILHECAKHNQVEIARIIISKRGIDSLIHRLHDTDKLGRTPLTIASDELSSFFINSVIE